MGFEPEIRDIIEQKGMKKSGRQTLMFSATFPTEIQAMARDFLEPDYIFLTIGQVGAAATGIQQQILQVDGREKRDTLVRLLEEGGRQRVLIFVTRKRDADALDDFLYRRGFPVTSIHGDRTQVQRENALESFKSAKTPILVATDVASRGLDIPQVNVSAYAFYYLITYNYHSIVACDQL